MMDMVAEKLRSYQTEKGLKQSCTYEVHKFKKLSFPDYSQVETDPESKTGTDQK
jgi:hypothetical protein